MKQKLTPYQLNADGKKLDLSNADDVALTIERNNNLEKAIEGQFPICELKYKAVLTFSFQCFKCGHDLSIQKKPQEDGEGLGIGFDDILSGESCKHCKTSYSYNWEYGDLKAKLKPKTK